jgi:hypothetical protein
VDLLLLGPVILSLLVLGAHFFRSGRLLLVLAVVALIACLPARRPWVPRLVQAALLLGTIEWVRTLVLFAGDRLRNGEPYVRLVIILGAVALVAALSALLFETAPLRRRYGRAPRPESGAPS